MASERTAAWFGGRVYYGWPMLAGVSTAQVVSWGILYYAFSVFVAPMQAELGWSTVKLTGAYSLALLCGGLAAVPVGRWLDRRGPRALMTVGSALAVLLVLAWSQVGSLPAFYAIMAGIGLVSAAVLPTFDRLCHDLVCALTWTVCAILLRGIEYPSCRSSPAIVRRPPMSDGAAPQIGSLWGEAVERFAARGRPLVRTASSATEVAPRAAWATCLGTLAELFAEVHGAPAVAARFQVPTDYASFMETIGGGWRCPYGLEWSLLDAAGVARATAANFRLWVRDADPDEPPLDPGLWLSIGWFSDKHEYVLCCDTAHPAYATVVDGHDSHPWLNGLDFGGCYPVAPSFAAWLKRLS